MNIPHDTLSLNSISLVELPKVNPKYTDLIDPKELYRYHDEFRQTVRQVLCEASFRSIRQAEDKWEWIYFRFAQRWNEGKGSCRIPISINKGRYTGRTPEYLWTRNMEKNWPLFGIDYAALYSEVRMNWSIDGQQYTSPWMEKQLSSDSRSIALSTSNQDSVVSILQGLEWPKNENINLTKTNWEKFRKFCVGIPMHERRFIPRLKSVDPYWKIDINKYRLQLEEYSEMLVQKYFKLYSIKIQEFLASNSSKPQ